VTQISPAAGRFDRRQQLVPVGVVGQNQRQLYTALLGALLDPHPARGHGYHQRLGQASGPPIRDRRGRRQDDLPFEVGARLAALAGGGGSQRAEVDTVVLIEPAQG
jgi:hypothetical protein